MPKAQHDMHSLIWRRPGEEACGCRRAHEVLCPTRMRRVCSAQTDLPYPQCRRRRRRRRRRVAHSAAGFFAGVGARQRHVTLTSRVAQGVLCARARRRAACRTVYGVCAAACMYPLQQLCSGSPTTRGRVRAAGATVVVAEARHLPLLKKEQLRRKQTNKPSHRRGLLSPGQRFGLWYALCPMPCLCTPLSCARVSVCVLASRCGGAEARMGRRKHAQHRTLCRS
jgi:hypothetical protein